MLCFYELNKTQFEVIVYDKSLANSELLEIKQDNDKTDISFLGK